MFSDPADFSRQHFKSPAMVDDDWFAWFREEIGPTLTKIEMTPAADTPFALEGVSRVLPDISVYRGTCSPAHSRNMTELVTDDDPSIIVSLAGRISLRTAHHDLELAPGHAVVVRNDVPTTMVQHCLSSFISIRLQRRRLQPLLTGYFSLHGLPSIDDPQALRLLLGYVDSLEEEEKIAAPEMQHLVTSHVHELAALAIGATRDTQQAAERGGKRAARLAAVKADIFSNLASPRLSVGTVAARQGVSPRYVQMLFETEGTSFARFVLEHRLARAYRLLRDPSLIGYAIQSIALEAGFGDLSYFNRTFRRRFGMTPSEMRNSAGDSSTDNT